MHTELKIKALQYVLDWIAIQELVSEYGQAIDFGLDTGEWSRWVNVFTPQVTADYSKFMGGGPSHMPREQMADVGKTALRAFRRVQHTTATNVRIHYGGNPLGLELLQGKRLA